MEIGASVNTHKCVEKGRANNHFTVRHLKRVRDYFDISADILMNYDLRKMLKEWNKN